MTVNAFDYVRVNSYTRGGTTVSWQLSSSLSDPGPYRFMLEWAPFVTGPWKTVSPDPVPDAVSLLDPKQRLTGTTDDLYYRVRVMTAQSMYRSEPVTYRQGLSKDNWLKAKELWRLATVDMDNNPDAERGCLYKRRLCGYRCPVCTSPTDGGPRLTGCKTCFDTGIVGGYWPPIPYTLILGPTKQVLQFSGQQAGMHGIGDGSAKGMGQPRPDPNDVWVSSATDRRYVVHPDQPVQDSVKIQQFVVQVQFALSLAPATSVIYDLPREGCGLDLGQGEPAPDPCSLGHVSEMCPKPVPEPPEPDPDPDNPDDGSEGCEDDVIATPMPPKPPSGVGGIQW